MHLIWRATNLGLEGMLLHARALADFFATPKVKWDASKQCGDDIVSEDYGFSPVVCLDAAIRERIDKDLAHLTYTSATRSFEDKGWTLLPFVELAGQCIKFADHLLATFVPHGDVQETGIWKVCKDEMNQIIKLAMASEHEE